MGLFIRTFSSVFIFLLGMWCFGAAAQGLLSDKATTPRVEARLVSSLSEAAPGNTVTLALEQKIIDGWHTYWKNPGDSGESIQIDWTLPDGVEAGALHYPVPAAIPVGPLMNYGYAREAVVLTDLKVPHDWPVGEAL